MTEMTKGQRSLELARKHAKGLKDAKASLDSNWEKAGHYLQRIDFVKMDDTRKSGVGLFVEKTIIHVFDDDDGDGHKVGESPCHSMWTKHDSFLGNVKAFLSKILGLPENDVTEENFYAILDDDQPLCGTYIEVKNRIIETRASKPFTKINYQREVPAIELAEILSDDEKEAFFPGSALDELIEYEASLEE